MDKKDLPAMNDACAEAAENAETAAAASETAAAEAADTAADNTADAGRIAAETAAEETAAAADAASGEITETAAGAAAETGEIAEDAADTAAAATDETAADADAAASETAAADAAAPKKKKHGVRALIIVLAALAIAALGLVAVNMFVPSFFNRIFGSTPLTRDSVVMTIGDYEVTAEEYNHYLYPYKIDQTASDEHYWETHLEKNDELVDAAETFFKNRYAMLAWAKDAGITVSSDEVDAAVEQARSSYDSDDAFYEALQENYLTVGLFRRLTEQSLITDKLYNYLYSTDEYGKVTDADAAAYAEEKGMYSAKHILIQHGADDAEDAKKLALAEDILAQLQAGADFDTLMNTYSEDSGLASYPNGYTFADGEMDQTFTDAVKALKVGEISGIVKTDYGYHIILRTQPSADDLYSDILSARVEATMNEYAGKMAFKTGRGYSKINIGQCKWDYPATSED